MDKEKTKAESSSKMSTNSKSEAESDNEGEKFITEDEKQSKRISEYYHKQNNMLECFKNDCEQIEAFNRLKSRKRAAKLSESKSEKDEKRRKTESGTNTEKSEKKDNMKEDYGSKESLMNRHFENLNEEEKTSKAAKRLAYITLGVNVSLMIAKMTASYISGSMSIISSMIDSIVDITSGLVLSVSTKMIEKRDPYLYPRGRTRLEPLALILISVIMGMASVQLIITSIQQIIEASKGNERNINVDYLTIGIMLSTICIKFILFMVCRKFKSNPTISVLGMDHRNDCVSNSVALACGWVATKYCFYMDPIGAIFVSIYIFYTWVKTGKSQILMLSGRAAQPEFINRIIKVCMDHDKRITHIDTVYVYHFGTKFLVEVHIVLDEKMKLKLAHDIAEDLQTNIESLPEVERAFVHTDYEFEHHPHDEHKKV